MNYYDEISSGYKELHREEQLKKLRLVKENIEIKEGEIILDLGCGSGFISEVFDNLIVGVDPSFLLLKKTRKFKNNRIIKINAKAEYLPFKEHVFDWVFCITAIHHFDLDKAIKEMKRVGKNKFVISVLKKSLRKEEIIKKIKGNFEIKKEIEEEKDVIYIIKYPLF